MAIVLPDEAPSDDVFEVDSDNWESVMAFCRCSTQWHYGAMGGVTGMDYPGVKTALDLTVQPKRQRRVYLDIQIMEQAAIRIINEQAKQQRERSKAGS